MVVDAGKSTDVEGVVAMDYVTVVEEGVVVIWGFPTTPGTVLIFKSFLGISAVSIRGVLEGDSQSYDSRQRIRENSGGGRGDNGACGWLGRGGGR